MSIHISHYVSHPSAIVQKATQIVKAEIKNPLVLTNPLAMTGVALGQVGVGGRDFVDYTKMTGPLSMFSIKNKKLKSQAEIGYAAAAVIAGGFILAPVVLGTGAVAAEAGAATGVAAGGIGGSLAAAPAVVAAGGGLGTVATIAATSAATGLAVSLVQKAAAPIMNQAAGSIDSMLGISTGTGGGPSIFGGGSEVVVNAAKKKKRTLTEWLDDNFPSSHTVAHIFG